MNDFTASDTDLVYRRNPERWIMLAVFSLEFFVFAGVYLLLLGKEPQKAMPLAIFMGIILIGLGMLAAWLWMYEVRLTPYELIYRSIFGSKTLSLSSIVGLERRRVKGKNPPTYTLKVTSNDGEVTKFVDMKLDQQWLHEKLRESCRSLKSTDFAA